MTLPERAASLVASLPPEKAEAVVEFAEYLAEKADEQHWQEQFVMAGQSPRFAQKVEQVERDLAAGRAEPLDLDKL